ncbi:PREDICTED: uncharacterized protein LOC105136332 isoform X2 [Populus euphratica]|uniref:Uncharacterized protein LOC105136332 isoform X2 n=1 Tax=Populus euphratica TaxID=75702 RepID=A0AAJ6V1M9_POPEU|nr:PREDICTED: uncharacterized protein LOC105136332 isoform X2 [Populus euphratica]
MDVLDSPIDALAFDYVNLGILAIINNLWTWVAVITAAVSFWRIRAAGAVKTLAEPSPSPDYIERQITESSHPETSSSSTATTATPKSVTEPAAPGSVSSSPSVFEDNGPKKGKFVVYYQDDDRQNEGNLDDDDEDGEEELTVLGEWRRCGGEITLWERMLRVSMGEYGWYRCQDLTVINGNVVRLWDGVRREKKSSGSVAW